MTTSPNRVLKQTTKPESQCCSIYGRAATYGVLLGLFLLVLEPAAALVQPNLTSSSSQPDAHAGDHWEFAGTTRWEFSGVPFRMRFEMMTIREVVEWIDGVEASESQGSDVVLPTNLASSEVQAQFVDVIQRTLPVLQKTSGQTVYGITHLDHIVRVKFIETEGAAKIASARCAIRRPLGAGEDHVRGEESATSEGDSRWVFFELGDESQEPSSEETHPLLTIPDGCVVLQGRDPRNQVCAQLVLTGRSIRSLVQGWETEGHQTTRLTETDHWAVATHPSGKAPVLGVCPLRWGNASSQAVLIQKMPAN
ncbi:MAG: hypothetical protein KDA52_02385 [Planctomycetaceae bacterium]|nr:hypothetical protein [Planctomycetaceae bacterium]